MHRLYYLLALSLITETAAARDYYVEKEVRCTTGGFCYNAVEETPLNGKLRQYYASGVVMLEAEYKNGQRNGVLSRFYPDGKQQVYEVYADGVLNGGASTYYNSGNIKTEKHYLNGVLNGDHKAYYEDGTIKLEGKYLNGKKHGRERQYDINGNPVNEITYNLGTAINAACRTRSGQKINYTAEAEKYISRETTPCRETPN